MGQRGGSGTGDDLDIDKYMSSGSYHDDNTARSDDEVSDGELELD